jgi:hypothetical protein
MNEIREEKANDALSDEDFDNLAVADCDNWVIDENIWSCKVYLDDPIYDNTIPASFTIWFDNNNDIIKSDWGLI